MPMMSSSRPQQNRSPSVENVLAGTPNYFGIPMGVRDYAAQTQAALSRRQFDDFISNYYGLLEQQAGQVGNEGYMACARDEARVNVANQLRFAGENRDMQLRSFGIELTPEQAGVVAKQDRLTAALSDVDAFNRTTQQVRDRDWQLLTGAQAPLSVFQGQQP
jgi:hypothetical protein